MVFLTFAAMIEKLVWSEIIFGAFCLIALIQIIYYLYFFRRLAFYPAHAEGMPRQQPVSVIICARDEAANLAKNLPGVLVQDYSDKQELILVNDNSVDETKYLIEALQKDFPQLQMLELKQEAQFIPGKKFPLSMGIKMAKNDILLLTDADCVPASEFWIQRMVNKFERGKEIVLGYGAYYKKKGLLNKVIRFETFHTALQYMSYALAGMPYMGVGRNLAYKKDVFYRHKGFSAHNHVPGGDDDLFINAAATSINTDIVVDKDSFTLSEPKKTWADWWQQKQRHYTTAKFYKTKHRFLLGCYAFSHFLFYPLLLVSALLFNWQLTVAVFGLRMLIQAVIFHKAMNRLNEGDLWKWFWAFDIGMFIYYLLFTSALWKRPKTAWK